MRGAGGNRFIDHDAGIGELLAAIQTGLVDLRAFANNTERRLDLGAVTVETRPTKDGRLISVTVTGDLAPQLEPVPTPAPMQAEATSETEGSA